MGGGIKLGPPFCCGWASKVMTAVSKNGLALKYASEELKDNSEIVLKAVSENGLALQYASQELNQQIEDHPHRQ